MSHDANRGGKNRVLGESARSAHGFARRIDALLSSRRFTLLVPDADADRTLVVSTWGFLTHHQWFNAPIDPRTTDYVQGRFG